jgi:hypothetical protein
MENQKIFLPMQVLSSAKEKGLVIMAGAGVSAVPPSSLPGWIRLNQMVVSALCERMDSYLGRAEYTFQLHQELDQRLKSRIFPPDYQAQIIAENSGENYFKALQALDLTAINPVHEEIAWLAKLGIVKAIVTTNFDCLLEQALEKHGVFYEAAYEPRTYKKSLERLENNTSESPIQLLKVHGSVKDHRSMIDTLKQRLQGRNNDLEKCLEILLQRYFWLFAGFSATDLESDENYLRLIPSAEKSPGIVYLQWPGEMELSNGAKRLLISYAGKSSIIKMDLEPFFRSLRTVLVLPTIPTNGLTGSVNTAVEIQERLKNWAKQLNPATVANCLACILEANGQTVGAFELLHRFWKDVLSSDREGPEFEEYRYHHGRLGMGGGLVSLVKDQNTTVGLESLQNLYRRSNDDPRATAWAALSWLWAGNLPKALPFLVEAETSLSKKAGSPEVQMDVWMALAEATYIFAPDNLSEILPNWKYINRLAQEDGDLPRQAKMVSITGVIVAEYPDLYPAFVDTFAKPILNRASRLNDPTIAGFAYLAQGRYFTKVRNGDAALTALLKANKEFELAGRPPWKILCSIELSKAYVDQVAGRPSAEAQEIGEKITGILNEIGELIRCYPVWLPWFEEAKGQYYLYFSKLPEARIAFEAAVNHSKQIGLKWKEQLLQQYLANPPFV